MHRDTRFRRLMDIVPVLIWCSDTDGNLVYLNKSWVEFTGRRPLRALTQSWTDRVHPDDEPRRAAVIAEHHARREPFRIEFRLNRRDDVWRWVVCFGALRTDENDAFAGFIGSCTDITDTKEAQVQRQRDLDEKAAVMQELHHRVKNNAQVFASLLSVQASRAVDPQVKDALRVAAARAATMTFAQQQIWDAGSSARFDLGALVRRLVRAQALRSAAVEVDAPLTLFVPLATAVPLGLIVHELLTNAIQHGYPNGEPGRILVKLWRDASTQVHMTVSDDGVGMSECAEEEAGRSAGLTIVRSLVRQLGATLDTAVEDGTEVHISLPCPSPAGA